MKRVLIIEDDPGWAGLLQRYATDAGVTARVVVSPGQALEMIDEWRPDGLWLDMLLAGETGMALLYELRSHPDLATLPVVVCSSVALHADDLRPLGVRAVFDKATITPDEARAAFVELVA